MLKKLPPGLVSDLLLNGLLPYLAYCWMMDRWHWTEVRALIWTTVIPMVVALVVLIRERRVDFIAGFSLFGIVTSVLAAVGSSDSRMLLVRESYSTLVIAVVFLGSALVRRPIIAVLAMSQVRDDAEKSARMAGALQDPVRSRMVYRLTYLWGWSMVLEVGLKLAMIETLSPAQVLLWGPISTYGVTGLTMAATLWMAHAARKKVEQMQDAGH